MVELKVELLRIKADAKQVWGHFVDLRCHAVSSMRLMRFCIGSVTTRATVTRAPTQA
jgi:hypothetical protein